MRPLRELLVRNRDFRRLFLASVVSMAGDWFSYVAVAGLVTELTGRPGAPAFVYAATVLPVFAASPLAGALADRFDRKRILVIADLVRVPIALALCLAAAWRSTPLAIGAVTALAVGASFSDPIASAATPNLVDAEDLASAQSLMGAVWGSMLMVGAGIGGLVAELFGRQAAFAVDAASFLASAWLIGGIRAPMQRAPERPSAGSVRDAVRYILTTPIVLRLVLAKTGVSAGNGIVGLLPAFAARRFSGTSTATGLLFAARGLGAMIGPMLARGAVGATPGRRAVIIVCGVSTLTYSVVYAAFPLTYSFGVAMVLVILAHLGGGAQWSLSTYGLQCETPDHFRGRVLSLDYGVATLWIGTSSIAAGVLADGWGEVAATWWLAAIGGGYGTVWLAWSLITVRTRPREG
ncbi:MAG: MFS transporter [Deltaproteobacteria bacterium]|nr:MAG: MFS transporter [Deltaproteobacteria bacterium]TMQ10638.1 MAG: MFS transporter [Deltaproteobacteria bacterium]